MKVTRTRAEINSRLRRIERDLEPLVRRAGNKFTSVTPKRSGNARRSTDVKDRSIEANYDYANRLNEGHSRQAPSGMTQPTIEFIRREVRKILR